MTRTVLCVAAAIALGLLPPAHARSLAQPPAWEAPGLAEAVDGILSEPELREALEAAGYSDVHTLRDDGDTYELIAQKDGSSVLLRVNTRTRRYSEGPADY